MFGLTDDEIVLAIWNCGSVKRKISSKSKQLFSQK